MRQAMMAAAAALSTALAGAAQAAPPPPPTTDEFVQAAAGSDRFEMMEAQVALVEGQGERVRAFARTMIQAHAATTQALTEAVAAAGLPPPPMAMGGDQASLLGALQGQRGLDFDKTYVRHQVLGHQQALVVAQGYADGGEEGPLRQAARTAVPIIRSHLEMAQRLCGEVQCGG